MATHKLSSLVGSDFVPFNFTNKWDIQRTIGPDRLVIGPSANQIALLLELTQILSEPFGILYVLLISRRGNQRARYQCPNPCTRIEMESFLRAFGDYFESDGRHHVWISSLPDSATLVYDQHDVIYAYGPLRQFEKILKRKGFEAGVVSFPSPHRHNYNPENDAAEERLFEYWNWRRSALMENDDL